MKLAALLVTILLAGCSALHADLIEQPAIGAPTSPPNPAQVNQTETSETADINSTPLESANPPDTPSALCESHQAHLQLVPSSSSLRVGDSLTMTATLSSSGCALLGLPKYSLVIHPEGDTSPFEPAAVEPVLHSIGLRDGEQDMAYFILQATAPGEVTIMVTASFEVHLGYPGPAYWAGAASQPLRVIIRK
ncbi:MAG: hypothetical protein ACWGO1_13260 [Anaerolineales bacterium]